MLWNFWAKVQHKKWYFSLPIDSISATKNVQRIAEAHVLLVSRNISLKKRVFYYYATCFETFGLDETT